jgi:hypothetical protein
VGLDPGEAHVELRAVPERRGLGTAVTGERGAVALELHVPEGDALEEPEGGDLLPCESRCRLGEPVEQLQGRRRVHPSVLDRKAVAL